MFRWIAICVGMCLTIADGIACAQSWIFNSAEYSHDPDTGRRVVQYEDLPTVERIPYREYFSEDGPRPYVIDYWGRSSIWYGGGWFDYAAWRSPRRGPYIYR